MPQELKKVTKEEFDAFLDSYEGPLETSLVLICDPPLRFYYIPEGQKQSMDCKWVAKIDYAYMDSPQEYFILP